jgi:hypothetical protein
MRPEVGVEVFSEPPVEGHAEAVLLPGEDLARQQIGDRSLEHPFEGQAPNASATRQAKGELDELVVEER